MTDAIKVLFVDDEENILGALRRLFRKAPWQCSYVTSGEEALARFRAEGPFDLVVSDQRMPGLCGVELLKALRLQYPQTVRMMLSSYTDVETVLSAINEGYVYKFLTKPWKNEVLYQTVAEIADGLEMRRENQRLLARLREQTEEISAVDWLVRELEGFDAVAPQECGEAMLGG